MLQYRRLTIPWSISSRLVSRRIVLMISGDGRLITCQSWRDVIQNDDIRDVPPGLPPFIKVVPGHAPVGLTVGILGQNLTSVTSISLNRVAASRMAKSKSEVQTDTADRYLYSGLIRVHVLQHAVEGPVFGLGMIEELCRHGYRIKRRQSVSAFTRS